MATSLPVRLSTTLLWAGALTTGALTPPSSPAPNPGPLPAATAGTTVDLAGAWRLVSLESIGPSGQATTGWLGLEPKGLLVYQPNGSMAVQLVRDPRADGTADPDRASAAAKARAFDGYYAYYGRYEVDGPAGLLRHIVEQSLWPTERGHTYTHRFRLRGDTLILEALNTFELDGEQRHSRITWAREH